jgi:arylsulfatase
MPTCIELAGAKYPKEYKGHKILSADGYSLMPLVRGRHVRQNRVLFFDHEGWSGMRQGRWKINRRIKSTEWELYDLKNDPYENVNLAEKYPRKLKRLSAKWEKMAKEMGVRPWPLDK